MLHTQFVTGFVDPTTHLVLERTIFIRNKWWNIHLLSVKNIFLCEYGEQKISSKTFRHKRDRVQSLKPLRAITWHDTKFFSKSADAWCCWSRFWMFFFLLPLWKCPQFFKESFPGWKKTLLAALKMGCVGVCVGGLGVARWGVCTVVLPKVMVGLINIRYVVILSRETGISIMLGLNAGKGTWKFHGMII